MIIEMDITYRCNAKCLNCCRFCNMQDLGFDFSDSDITLDQVKRFIDQVKRTKKQVSSISVMGGEPLLHPNIVEIATLLKNELVDNHHIKSFSIISNKILNPPKELKRMEVLIENYIPPRFKSKHHRCTLVAPVDLAQETKICNLPKNSGIGFSKYGYTPCAAGGAIIRLFKLYDLIKYELPKSENDWGDISKLCRLCQASAKKPLKESDYGRLISVSFQEAIKIHRENPLYPALF